MLTNVPILYVGKNSNNQIFTEIFGIDIFTQKNGQKYDDNEM